MIGLVAILRRLEMVALAAAGVGIVAMMLIVSVDALLRYTVGTPIPWSYDLVTYYLMVAVYFLPLAATQASGDHIRIEVLQDRLPRGLRTASDLVLGLLAAALFAAIAWLGGEATVDAWTGSEYLPGYIKWPMWLSYWFVPVGAGLLVCRMLVEAACRLRPEKEPLP